jgi:hypothetical protein
MDRAELILEVKKYFKLQELVSKVVYDRYGEDAWYVFGTDILQCLLLIRVGLGKSITINDWLWGGTNHQRGYRENLSKIVKDKTEDGVLYISGHVLGCALDLHVKGMIAEDVRTWILANQEIFPCKIRLEHRKLSTGEFITWVHIDTKYYEGNPKVYLFNVA